MESGHLDIEYCKCYFLQTMNIPHLKKFLLLVFLTVSPCRAAAENNSLEGHLQSAYTGRLEIVRVSAEDDILSIVLDGDCNFLRGRDQEREDLVRQLLWTARELSPGIAGIQLYVRRPAGGVRLLNEALRDPDEESMVSSLRALPGPRLRGLPPEDLPYGGSLAGKTIVISPGHGWTYYDSLDGWSTQRGLINMPGCETCLGIIEDYSNAEIAARYLIPNLLRAGATVWSVRERDFSEHEWIVDEDSQGVVEGGAWADGTSAGGYGDDYRVLPASGEGSIEYSLRPDYEGDFWVSVWYVAGSNRVSDALFSITHAGGVARHHLDQRANGSRWIHLGRYRFGPNLGALRIEAGQDADREDYVIADAVRLGGGFDDTVVQGVAANKPRWMMNALQYLAYLGLPEEANTGSDVTVRPAFAEWQGADAYLSLHSNASGSSAHNVSGTSTYRFNCYTYPDHSAAPDPELCDDPPGSDALQRAVHTSIVDVLRENWDPYWRDRGPLVANFGEMRVLENIPGALVESAFHDGTEKASAEMRMPDNQALQDPRFRHWLGFAIYAGLARFFDPDTTLLPANPPQGLYLVHASGNGLLVGWEAVDGALAYRVRWATGDPGLGPGLVTDQTSVVIDEYEPGQLVLVRVSALNDGGEGPPSELAVARYRGNGTPADVLIVAGFDRQDAYLGDWRNRRDQAWAHALAIGSVYERKVYFDFASNEAVAGGQVPLEAYRAVIWALGEESTVDETFSADEQGVALTYLDSGGGLMATGAEIGWDLVEQGTAEDLVFFADAFGAVYISDDAGTSGVLSTGSFAGIPDFAFDDGSAGIYPVEYPDVLEGEVSEVVLTYDDGSGAAVAFERKPGRSLLFGFPFETVTDPAARVALIDACLIFLMPGHTPDDFDSDGLPDAWEHENGTDPLTPSADADPDGDGKTNMQEYEEGTDPQVPDDITDGGTDGGTNGGTGGGGCGCTGSGHGGDSPRLPLALLILILCRAILRRKVC